MAAIQHWERVRSLHGTGSRSGALSRAEERRRTTGSRPLEHKRSTYLYKAVIPLRASHWNRRDGGKPWPHIPSQRTTSTQNKAEANRQAVPQRRCEKTTMCGASPRREHWNARFADYQYLFSSRPAISTRISRARVRVANVGREELDIAPCAHMVARADHDRDVDPFHAGAMAAE
jgi:hypothetical protein